ncbi:MAG: hypothetical protein IJS68_01075 [Clostridia bacterium]|nr:hypothetical protein [Clostridia bacterium]
MRVTNYKNGTRTQEQFAQKKKNRATKIKSGFLIGALALSGLYFIFLLLGLFNVLKISAILPETFNYLMAFAIIIACLALYSLALFIETHNRLEVPVWIACSFYIAFFIFTNIYYLFGLYSNTYFSLFFYVVLGVLVSILSLSIYFNCLKDEAGLLKNRVHFTGFILFAISTTLSVIFKLVVMFIKFVCNVGVNLTLETIITFGILLLISTIFAICFDLSIGGKKTFANACLIKTISREDKI